MSSEKDEQFWTTLGGEGHPHPLPLPFSVQKDYSSSSSSFSLSQSTNLFNHHDQAENYREIHGVSDQTHRQYEQPNDVFSLQTNSKDQFFDDNHGIPARTQTAPIKWMSSNMRFLRKMTGEEEHVSTMKRPKRRMPRHQCHSLLKREIDTVIRVCSDCNTTKTPLWRGGPQGPKSLCNACGIRQMKARRAVMASAIARKNKVCDVDRTIPYKKRYKFTDRKAEHLKLRFNETSSPAVFHSGFPQDEKDAAILLMALSCG